MARNPRILPPSMPVHVTQRGHNRASCFVDDEDRRAYLYFLREALVRFSVDLHAYALMTNHVHLLMTPREIDAVSAAVMSYSRKYVQYFNGRHERTGTLWDGRFKSSVIEQNAYLFACYRYIEMNPVRAGMVRDPGDYVWSSYRANALGEANLILVARDEYRALGGTAAERQQAYRHLFADVVHDKVIAAIRLAVDRSRPLRVMTA